MPDAKEKVVLHQSILDAIREHLPEHISKTLRDRLAEADEAIKAVPHLEATIRELNSALHEHGRLDERDVRLTRRSQELEAREKAIEKAELRLETDKTKHELTCEKGVTKTLTDALLGLVRNTTYRENQWHDHEKVSDYQNGNSVTTAIPKSTNVDRVAE